MALLYISLIQTLAQEHFPTLLPAKKVAENSIEKSSSRNTTENFESEK